MADDRDDSQKTEQPSHKRLQEAEAKGDVVQSPEIAAWFVLAAATAFIALWGTVTATQMRDMVTGFLSKPHAVMLDAKSVANLVSDLGLQLLLLLSIPFAILVAVGIGSHWLQHPPVFSAAKMKPDINRLNPLNGFGKIFGRVALMNFAKGLIKTGLAAAAIGMVAWPAREQLLGLVTMPVTALLPLVQSLTVNILMAVLAILAIIAVVDYGWQYMERMRRLRMTRQEVKDEYKQSEGDPIIKARLRQIRSDRQRRRMMANIAKASVIITNPTHYAVALMYDQGKTDAPICVAKGVDHLALKIREVGQEHNIPIVENPPLARSLYATVDIDESIKPEHYKAVAQVIGYVMRLKNKTTKRPKK